ncbi:helix-turn-helix domain-containing protein [Psychrobium sp. 1_MG-2023]|uniref:helix-turn-helix domain-containing protein n=1 Tax=Psychrobium sp. 1_MG-2023 TaxID=3062624 RepID=UPI000C320B69|nr:helix-turn-helix transcriptional regulator [Psychrobium sp. 1_MG-2023]MDP2560007.1 helix-turn-helix transcriptional regulator [Psychrobium sp. 1_MG-2023]PKF56331.1 XRE family transcriptional regulator [Alteromonadales bacterium alter-6D02]
MTLGEQLKALRSKRGMSQPQLSELAGIEQSYLSKLENDKSLPSNDIFRQLLTALDTTLTEFLSPFDLKQSQAQLSQIPDIELWLKQQATTDSNRQRHYLYFFSAMIVIATVLFFIGISKQVYSETQYQYLSPGVVKADEPDNIFEGWRSLINHRMKDYHDLVAQKGIEMYQRRDKAYLTSVKRNGQSFEVKTPQGRRVYVLEKTIIVPRQVNAWLQVFGVLFFSIGIMGFIIERRVLTK